MIENILKYINPQVLIIGGGFIAAFGTYLASKQSDFDSLKNEKLLTQIQTQTNQITGGNSFCVIDPFFDGKYAQFLLRIIGENKLENVNITIRDVEKGSKYKLKINDDGTVDRNEVEKLKFDTTTKLEYNALYPNAGIDLKVPIAQGLENLDYHIVFWFGNRNIVENIKVTNYKTEKRKIVVTVKENNKILYERK